MRATVSPLLLVPCLLFACSDNNDPLDGLTAVSLSGATATADPPTSTDDPATTSAGTDSGASDPGTTGDPSGTATNVTLTTNPTNPTTTTTGDPDDPYEQARQLCVDTINMYRATLGLPAYERWTDAEDCSDAEAFSDGQTGVAHGAFGMCEEFAQNECPGYPSPAEESLPGCLAQMWAEGPGEDFNMHGHYINMSSEQYTKVACGFAEGQGGLWMVQNFQ